MGKTPVLRARLISFHSRLFALQHPSTVLVELFTQRAFPGSSVIKNLPGNAGDAGDVGQSLSREDPLEEEMAIHSSMLAWEIPQTEQPGGLWSIGSQRVTHD